MAKVIYGDIVTGMSGSVGGWTFQNNNSGAIIRQKPKQLKTYRPLKNIAQSKLYNLLGLYTNLSFANKVLWNAYAAANPRIDAFGVSRKMTGANAFVSVNSNLLFCEQSIADSPPTYEEAVAVPACTVTMGSGSIGWSFDLTLTTDHMVFMLWTTAPMKLTKGNFRGKWRQTLKVISNSYSAVDVSTYYYPKWNLVNFIDDNAPTFQTAYMGQFINSESGVASVGRIIIKASNFI